MTHTLQVHLKGGLLLGGAAVGGFHDVTLRDANGLPFLPASALKGAVREQLRRLTSQETADRLLGKQGRDPLDPTSAKENTERPGGGTTRVYFTDAVLSDQRHRELFESGAGWAARAQVSIDRKGRTSARRHLFVREVLAPFVEGLRFEAEVDLSRLGAEDLQVFRAGLRAVFALGGSRTSGLGRADLSLQDRDPATNGGRAEDAEELVSGDAIELVLTAEDPVCMANHFRGNLIESQDCVPSTTLRGAVITSALEARGITENLSADPDFRRLFLDEATCVRFSEARPLGDDRVSPLTLRECKKHPGQHPKTDSLVRSYLQVLAAEKGVFWRPDDTCPECGGRRRAASGSLSNVGPTRRVITRLGLDARSARAGDGQLFSIEVLERGTRFLARAEGLDEESRAYLRDAAKQGLRVGHGRGQGYGRCQLELRAAQRDALRPRLVAFDAALRQALLELATWLEVEPEALGADQSHFAVTLLGPLQPGGREHIAEAAMVDALGPLAGVEVVYCQAKTGQRGGWDALGGRPKPLQPILAAGSTLLLRSRRALEELEPELDHLERRGAGRARAEGYGWLRVSDPIHLSTRRSR